MIIALVYLAVGLIVGWAMGFFLERLRRVWTLKEEMKTGNEKYAELLYAVQSKYKGESRHETALRYILEAENCRVSARVCVLRHQDSEEKGK